VWVLIVLVVLEVEMMVVCCDEVTEIVGWILSKRWILVLKLVVMTSWMLCGISIFLLCRDGVEKPDCTVLKACPVLGATDTDRSREPVLYVCLFILSGIGSVASAEQQWGRGTVGLG